MQQAAHPESPKSKPPKPEGKHASLNLLTRSTAFFALLYVLACLIGYGAALAIESRLAVPADALFASSLDLVVLSKYSVLALLTNLEVAWPRLGMLILEKGWVFWGAALGIALWAKYPWTPKDAKRTSRVGRAVQFARDRWSALPKNATLGQKIAALLSAGLLVAPGLAVVGPVVAMVLVAFPIVFLPYLGFKGADSYLQRWVLDDVRCQGTPASSVPSNGREVAVLPCIRWSKDNSAAEGMVLVSTPTALVVRTVAGEITTISANREGGLQVLGELRLAASPASEQTRPQ